MVHPVIQCKFFPFIDVFCTLNGFPGIYLHYCNFLCFIRFRKIAKSCYYICHVCPVSPSVCPNGKTRLPLGGYS